MRDDFEALVSRVRALRTVGATVREAHDLIMQSREPTTEDLLFFAWQAAVILDGE